nr:unnamed protein product [Callosobruchus chinensis]
MPRNEFYAFDRTRIIALWQEGLSHHQIVNRRTFNWVISTATIRRRVLASGLRCRRPLRVPLLTARHRTARLQWARAHQDWLLPQWRNVHFSDESRFGLVSDDYRERVWRERGGENILATAIERTTRKVEEERLVDGSILRQLHARDTYTYLGVAQSHIQEAKIVKECLRRNYLHRLRQISPSELSGKNKVAATNMLAVPLILYTFGAIRWMRLHNRVVLATACYVTRSTDPLICFVREHEKADKGAFIFKAPIRAAEELSLTIDFTRRSCKTHVGTAYIHRHKAALRVLYYHLRQSYGNIESFVENESCRIYWNNLFPSLELVQANKPDIILLDHQQKTMLIIEFSAPAEVNIVSKEEEKRTKYQELLGQLRRLWPDYAVSLLVMVIGSLGGMRNTLLSALRVMPVCVRRRTS